jgi:hypothetical protein
MARVECTPFLASRDANVRGEASVLTERGRVFYVRCFFFSAAGNSTLLRISR